MTSLFSRLAGSPDARRWKDEQAESLRESAVEVSTSIARMRAEVLDLRRETQTLSAQINAHDVRRRARPS
jgi:hypothetical protein